jgi:alpha-amylase/alpha-mannosidase (GH57 family)
MQRAICVHGHFYQPPRENPWLELVERQPGAYPFHDWNERITVECYEPNTRARILDDQGRIVALVNNYARMSFNLGPTLLSWLEDAAPETSAALLAADRKSQQRFGGHGSALAQAYSHPIMPLADPRDARTQVIWGVRDFRHRFGRAPEGMWLPETAVDDATLELLVDAGIRFTILAPHQAARVRAIGTDTWTDVSGGRVDPTMPYEVPLPSGRRITVFLYDGPISHDIAFNGLLEDGSRLAGRLVDGFRTDRDGPQLVHVATDGETYGHHHRHGEMALASALELLDARTDVVLTNYAQFLAEHPPTHEVTLVQHSSWSCVHGIERWRDDCGCGNESGLHQRWRAPLRKALDALHAELADIFVRLAGELVTDPWAARDDYIDVILSGEPAWHDFVTRHARGTLDAGETRRLRELLELQRHALLMFTSCGWFFDELSRPEPVQVLRYAARALQLAESLTGRADLEVRFVAALALAESNDATYGDGRGIYEQLVRPGIASLAQVTAHYAITSLFDPTTVLDHIGAFTIESDEEERGRAGRARFAVGRVTITAVATGAREDYEYGVLHLGDHNFTCGVRRRGDAKHFAAARDAVVDAFRSADLPGVIRALDLHFPGPGYSIGDLFRDEQQRILDLVLSHTLEDVHAAYRGIVRGRVPMLRYLARLDAPLPAPLRGAAEVVLHRDLTLALGASVPDRARVLELLEEAEALRITVDGEGLGHTLSTSIATAADRLHRLLPQLAQGAFDLPLADVQAELDNLSALVELIEAVPFDVDRSPAQDIVWRLLATVGSDLQQRAPADPAMSRVRDALHRIAGVLHVAVPPGITAPR